MSALTCCGLKPGPPSNFMAEHKVRPELIVFDLDYTLWPFWVDTHVDPPFKKNGDKVYDSQGHHIQYYKDVPKILEHLQSKGYKLGIASRTGARRDAESLLQLFDWNKYFTYKEIYPGCKVRHFTRFHEQSSIPYNRMIFFDDEHRNIVDTSKIGVHAVFVENGVSWQVVNDGLEQFSRR